MEDFEKAIFVVFDQGQSVSPDVRAQANTFCDAIKSRPDVCRVCWDQFLQSNCLQVKFWCLQTVPQAIPALAPGARSELRGQVLAWLKDVAPVRDEEVVIRNKIALVYVGLLRMDYPAGWPTGWKDLVSLLDKGPALVDMFLRILAVFDQEVVTDEVPRSVEDRQLSQAIKHAMREQDVLHLAECWYMILGTYRQSMPQLVIDCLKAISIYIVWVEILTVANDKFLGVICGMIADGGPASMEACECLAAILSKKMSAGKKITMLRDLRILQRLEECMRGSSGNPQLLEKQAELFNSVGEVALDAYVELRHQSGPEMTALAAAAWDFVKALMPFVFLIFAHQDYQIAGSVEPYLTHFFREVKGFVACSGAEGQPSGVGGQGPCHVVGLDEMRPILMQTLQLIIQRIAYPDWFQHGDPGYEDDERHLAFIEFRRSLTKIYKRIFLVDEQMGFQFVQASITQLTQRLASVRPMEAEAVLYLYKEAGEIVKDVAAHLQASGPLAASFVQLVECEALVKADHWATQLGLIELYVRYGRIFSIHLEMFPRYGERVLEAFVGAQGIRSSDPRVVSRACMMFPKFVKHARRQIMPVTTQLYEALKDLLVVQYIPSTLLHQANGSMAKVVVKGTLKAEDQACLYEAVASLVSAMPPEQMRPALQMLLKAPAGNLAETLHAPPARLSADLQGYASWAARSIEAIATITKAFDVKHVCVIPDWEEALTVVARTLDRFVSQGVRTDDLWRAALLHCRRMVEVIGEQFLGPLDTLLPLLCSGCSQAELVEITCFAHHVVCRFQRKTEPVLQKWLPELFSRPYAVWGQMTEESEQLKREKLELGCALLQLLKEAAKRGPAAMLEPMLAPGGTRHGQDMTAFLLQGLADPRELRALHLAASAWSALVEVAVATPASQEALRNLPMAQLMQRLLWSSARMDFSDATAQKVLSEVASVLRHLTSPKLLAPGLTQQATECMQQALVAALPGLRTDTAPRRLCEALSQDSGLKDIRDALQQCAADWRRDTGGGL